MEGSDNQTFTNENSDNKVALRDKDNNISDKTESDDIEDCSLLCLRLRFLNMFRSAKWFLVFLCMAATVQGLCINGLVNVVITTIERRFGLKSTQSGIIASSYDIGSLLIMVPVSYLGGRIGASKPRWIAVGMFCLGLGSMVWTLPHFATPVYTKHAETTTEQSSSSLCVPGQADSDNCDGSEETTSLSDYRYVFIFGQLLHGIGAAPLVSLGTTFLDESVGVKSSSVYIGIFQTFFLVGPAIGFVLGGQLLSIHTDFITDSGLTTESSLWVGAWWPGFLISFAWAMLCCLCIICYPPNLNKKKTYVCQQESEKSKSNVLKTLSDEFISLMKNPTYVLISIAVAIDAIIVSGMASFMPKYLEQQFSMSTGGAAQIFGLLIVPAGGSATFLAGLFLKKFVKSRNGAIGQCILAHSITIPLWFIFMMYCPSLSYVGVNTGVAQSSSLSSSVSSSLSPFLSSCNQECSCSTSILDPVCGSDGLMYVSPCLAGCSGSVGADNFTSCGCVQDQEASAVRRLCDSTCTTFIPFVIVMFILIFLTFWITMPSTMATLRCVREHERSFAIGLQTIIIRLLGSIPGPVLFGYFIDKTCDLWDHSCDETGQGSCLLYNNYDFAVFMCSCCVVSKSISLIFFILSVIASKKSDVPDITQEDDNIDDAIDNTFDVRGGGRSSIRHSFRNTSKL